MKVYVDFKELDAEDMPSNISNKYDLRVRSINCGSEYRNVELVSLSNYTKQVRKEAVKEVLDFIEEHKAYYFEQRDYYGAEYIFFNRSNLEKDILDQIQDKGEE